MGTSIDVKNADAYLHPHRRKPVDGDPGTFIPSMKNLPMGSPKAAPPL